MHKKVVTQVVKYCKTYNNDGMIFKLNLGNGIECYIDIDFARN